MEFICCVGKNTAKNNRLVEIDRREFREKIVANLNAPLMTIVTKIVPWRSALKQNTAKHHAESVRVKMVPTEELTHKTTYIQ